MNLLIWLGHDYVSIPYIRKKRKEGKSGFTFSKKVKHVIDSFVGFSYFPIKLLPIIGIIFAVSSFFYGGYSFFQWVIGNNPPEGWTTTIIIIRLMGGIQMIMLGILGEYLWRVLDETRKRPQYVIDKIYDEKLED
jgi:hypothetical protein